MHRRESSAVPCPASVSDYLSELGPRVCKLVIGWPEVGWMMTRPAISDTVQGTFGLRLDPIPTMAHSDRYTSLVFREQAQLTAEAVEELDALTVLGGHSADVLRVDPAVTGFVADAWQRGVRPFLSRIGTFPSPVVSRPPMLGVHAVMGNFGMSLPLHELNDTRYPVVPIADLTLDDFDAVMIPGAFCPWNCLDEGSPVELCRRAAAAGKVVAR